jgi:SSS family solute:Na+ symporter
MNFYIFFLGFYSVVLILLGLILAKKVATTTDFFVAGRKLNSTLLFSTMLAANIGAGSTVGAAGLAYKIGLSAWWWVGSAGIGSLLLAFTVGPKIWELASRNSFLTVGDFLEYRFGASVRLTITVLLWFGTLFILAGQLIAVAWILNTVSGIPKWAGSLIGGSVVVIYFSTSGLKGTAWINLIQLIVKGVGFLISLPFLLTAAGWWNGIVTGINESGRPPEFFNFMGSGLADVLPYVALLAPSFIVSPGLIQKIFGAKDSKTVRTGVALNGIVLLFFAFVPVLFGIAAAASFPNLNNPELALPIVITEILPVWLGALLLAAVFSAEISSADAILFMLSSSLSKDLYQRHIQPEVSDQSLLRISRLIAFSAGILGIFLAILLESVISALSVFYSLLSVALFAPLVVGLFNRIPDKKACLTAIFLSLAGTVVLNFITNNQEMEWLSPTVFGIGISSIIMLLATLRPAQESRDWEK